jgi:aspartyl-tRNA(Asn)/glutamyl-tRNA(Gln) amidotransferase subunit B
VAALADPKTASNWVTREVLAACHERGVGVEGLGLAPEALAEVIGLVEEGTISRRSAKRVLRRVLTTGRRPASIVEAEGLDRVTEEDRLAAWVDAVLDENGVEAARYRAGETRLLEYLIGEVMRRSKGRADAGAVRALLLESLET